jgi:hypothetical protein
LLSIYRTVLIDTTNNYLNILSKMDEETGELTIEVFKGSDKTKQIVVLSTYYDFGGISSKLIFCNYKNNQFIEYPLNEIQLLTFKDYLDNTNFTFNISTFSNANNWFTIYYKMPYTNSNIIAILKYFDPSAISLEGEFMDYYKEIVNKISYKEIEFKWNQNKNKFEIINKK